MWRFRGRPSAKKTGLKIGVREGTTSTTGMRGSHEPQRARIVTSSNRRYLLNLDNKYTGTVILTIMVSSRRQSGSYVEGINYDLGCDTGGRSGHSGFAFGCPVTAGLDRLPCLQLPCLQVRKQVFCRRGRRFSSFRTPNIIGAMDQTVEMCQAGSTTLRALNESIQSETAASEVPLGSRWTRAAAASRPLITVAGPKEMPGRYDVTAGKSTRSCRRNGEVSDDTRRPTWKNL